MTTNIDRIKSRIQKLLALADDDAAAAGEIDNALRFARQLMLEHQLTDADVTAACTGQTLDPHEAAAREEYRRAWADVGGRCVSGWEGQLMMAVCDVVGTVKVYVTPSKMLKQTRNGLAAFDATGQRDRGAQGVFYGPAADAVDAAVMFEEWRVVIAALARARFGGALRGEGRSYCEGFVSAIRAAIKAQTKTEDTHRGTDLILASALSVMAAKRERAATWLAETTGTQLKSGNTRAGNTHHSSAYGAGRADGARAEFRRGSRRIDG